MKIAIISDIHGNLKALETVLQDIDSRGNIDKIICLGDLVEGGEFDREVIELIRAKNIPCVRGNHDEFNDCDLDKDVKKWLSNLPEKIKFDNLCFTHISPREKAKQWAITSHIEAWNVFDEFDYQICFIGHLHYPIMYGEKCQSFAESTPYYVDDGIYDLDKEDRFIICFGAIAYPRHGGKFIRYGIYDNLENSIEFVILEGYLLPLGLCKP
ncbi:metallophosphoesterase family protein [Geminocystis herdmanii]|uniref:metallophosphoesterase family protein n=1 Tax=Geminocystis herdmanii TaxID=669359 RepID=UPI000349B8F9|nr:metallophosphoesterase [Geminocystis herdmanii]